MLVRVRPLLCPASRSPVRRLLDDDYRWVHDHRRCLSGRKWAGGLGPGYTAELGGFEIGGPVTVISALVGRLELTLAGIAVFGEDDSLGGAKFLFFDLPTAQAVLQRPGRLSGGSVQVTPGAQIDEVIAGIKSRLPDHATVVSGQDAAEEEAAEIQGALFFLHRYSCRCSDGSLCSSVRS